MILHKDISIKQIIGEGGMATVYLADHLSFNCEVAVKVLNKEFVYNDHIRKRFIDEARKLYRMNHPRIIRVTQIIEEKEEVAFVMEYLKGQSLKEFIESRDNISANEIVGLFLQMLDALNYVHQQKLVHRDIKPSNFMLTADGELKLLDFGIAKNNDNNAEYTSTSASYQMGTPMYMSPEQINDSRNVTSQSDIYSLGVVLWCMIMGKKPYQDNSLSTFQLLNKIVNEKLEPTKSIFQSIIDKCTEKDLSKRYKNCKEIESDIKKIIAEDKNKTISYSHDSNQKNSGEGQETLFVKKSSKKSIIDVKLTNGVKISIAVFVVMILFGAVIFITNSKKEKSTIQPPVINDTVTAQVPEVVKIDSSDNPIKSTEIDTRTKDNSSVITKTKPVNTEKTTVKKAPTQDNNQKVEIPKTEITVTEASKIDPVKNTTTTEVVKQDQNKTSPPEKKTKAGKVINNVVKKVKNIFKKD
jgi:serine/threonine protein kinase